VFHCKSEDVAVAAARELSASKLVFMHNGELILDELRRHTRGSVVHNLPYSLAKQYEDNLRNR
jgi:acetylglutamate kinase